MLPKHIIKSNLAESIFAHSLFLICRTVLHWAQWHCCHLDKMRNDSDNWAISYGQTSFARFEFKISFGVSQSCIWIDTILPTHVRFARCITSCHHYGDVIMGGIASQITSLDCLLNRLFRCRSKKTSKLRVTGLCAGNSPGPKNSPHKWPVTRKTFPFDDVIMRFISADTGESHRCVFSGNWRLNPLHTRTRPWSGKAMSRYWQITQGIIVLDMHLPM